MLENPNEEVHYFEVKKLLQNHFDLFPKSELTGIYSFLLNFCIRKINENKDKMRERERERVWIT